MVATRRAYAGDAQAAVLTAPISAISTSLVCDALLGWPTGGTGNFAAVIARGLANEEKILCSASSGGTLTVSQRGYDGTAAATHSATEIVEHIFTSIDADEANSHGSKVAGHGVPDGDAIVGVAKAQTLTNKVISGATNTISALTIAMTTGLQAALDALTAADVVHTAADVTHTADIASNLAAINGEIANRTAADAAEISARTTAIGVETTNRTAADVAHAAAGDPHPTYMTSAEVTAAIDAAAPVASAWSTSLTGFNIVGTWSTPVVKYRTLTIGAYVLVDLFVQATRTGSTISASGTTNISNDTIFSQTPTAIRPVQAAVDGHGPGGEFGRIVSMALTPAGVLDLTAMGGSSDLAAGEAVTARFVYVI